MGTGGEMESIRDSRKGQFWFLEQMGDNENQTLEVGRTHCIRREGKRGPVGQIIFCTHGELIQST